MSFYLFIFFFLSAHIISSPHPQTPALSHLATFFILNLAHVLAVVVAPFAELFTLFPRKLVVPASLSWSEIGCGAGELVVVGSGAPWCGGVWCYGAKRNRDSALILVVVVCAAGEVRCNSS